ncbi:uncharacterized protein LOC115462549 [Microcaecilia unicolor]|uniref:Uncharacterized protein LOC115462549 n=1 Tax=Microcaecilia unicolor TaxID=1415580 RepID=A0A6P7WYT0_9AMPH|nr:uncharacterized protein LOC115462549 [Microcaecilia unicolor]
MPKKKGAPSLKTVCLNSIAQHMQAVWVKDYSENYIDEHNFLYIMGPFNELAGVLVQELLRLLGESRRLTRAMLHLLLVPHLTELSMRPCPGLVSNAITQLITVRCKNLTFLDLHGCNRVPSAALVDLLECLPRLLKLVLSETQSNTQVLSAIGSTCKVLRELDISNCKKLSAESLLHLVYDTTQSTFCCSKLRVLVVFGNEPRFQVENFVRVIAFVLLAVPSLEYLDSRYVMEALCMIHSYNFEGIKNVAGFPSLEELAKMRMSTGVNDCIFQVTLHLRRVNEVEEQFLSMLSTLCRDVKEVTIFLTDCPVAGWSSVSWKHLTHLSIHCTGPKGRPLAKIIPVLEGLGPQLQLLSLSDFFLDEEFSLCAILNLCPNLRVFHGLLNPISGPLRLGSRDLEEEPQNWDLQLIHQMFPFLSNFSLILSEACGPLPSQFATVLGATLACLLKASPVLETLSLISLPVSLDRVFQIVLEPPAVALLRLKQISLCESRVSSSTIHLLLSTDNQLGTMNLEHCPDIHQGIMMNS